jgi:hypothetical protein
MSIINQLALLTLDPAIYSKESYLYFYAAIVILSPAMVKLLTSTFLFCNATLLTVCNEKASHALFASNLPAYFCAEERIIWKTMHALKEYYSSVKLN